MHYGIEDILQSFYCIIGFPVRWTFRIKHVDSRLRGLIVISKQFYLASTLI